jgi:hypothetical protein
MLAQLSDLLRMALANVGVGGAAAAGARVLRRYLDIQQTHSPTASG